MTLQLPPNSCNPSTSAKTKFERERDELPAFDEKVQAALTEDQELEDDNYNQR